MTQQHVTPEADKVPLGVKVAWGFGGIADNFIMNVLNALGLIIYVTHFKMDARLVGIAMFIPRFIDAFFDPLVGVISDNTRSRWGRRRPYMIAGTIISALLMPLLWTPMAVSTVGEIWYKNIPFIYFTLVGIIYALAYSLFVVPYTALGFELTNDYDEKTRALAWRMYLGLGASMVVPMIYWLCRMKIWGNEGNGAIAVSIILGVVVIVTGLVPCIACPERKDVQTQETVTVWSSISYTFTNIPFMILTLAYLIIIFALFSPGSLGMVVGIYYICKGDKDYASWLGMIGGIIGALTSYGSMFFISWLSRRWSKGFAMNMGLGFGLAGVLLSWFSMDPRWPRATWITCFISSIGFQGCWLMISSMIADVCDEDELKTGVRREGMFGAVNAFTQKLAIAVTSGIGGFLIAMTGFDEKTIDTVGVTLDTALKMKFMMIGMQAVGLLLAIIVFLFYPITRERAAETRRKLEERKRRVEAPKEDMPAPAANRL